jgi:hypothetical protein
MNNHEPPAHLVSCLLCCCAAKTTSSHLSTCICDRESRSPKPSFSAILHRERVNNIFGKRSSLLLTCFFKFFTTVHLPLCRTRAKGRHLQRELCQHDRCLHLIVVVQEPQVTYGSFSQIMSYIFNLLICVGMIFLDSLLQYLLFIVMIDLSRNCGNIATLIWNALVMFIIYPLIKIKLKMLIFPTIQKPYYRHFSFMDGFIDALRPTPFTGANFKRW